MKHWSTGFSGNFLLTSGHLVTAWLSFKYAVSQLSNNRNIRRRNIRGADFPAIKAKAAISSCVIADTDNISTVWNTLKSYLPELSLPPIPVSVRKKTEAKPPWFDSATRNLLRRRTRYWCAYVSASSACTFQMYRKVRNACRQYLRRARSQHVIALPRTSSSNAERYFAYIKWWCNPHHPSNQI